MTNSSNSVHQADHAISELNYNFSIDEILEKSVFLSSEFINLKVSINPKTGSEDFLVIEPNVSNIWVRLDAEQDVYLPLNLNCNDLDIQSANYVRNLYSQVDKVISDELTRLEEERVKNFQEFVDFLDNL